MFHMDSKTIGIAIVALVVGGIGGYAVGTSGGTQTNTAMENETTMADSEPMGDEMMDSGAEMDADTGDGMMGTDEVMAEPGSGQDIVALAIDTPSLSTLVSAVQAAELVDTLSGPGPFTVFAPTNTAFDALPAGTVDELLMPENQEQLQAVLTYHVVPGTYMAGDLTDGMTLTTVEGSNITVGVHDGMVTIDGATVEMADIEASNGVVHVIDQVILPPEQ